MDELDILIAKLEAEYIEAVRLAFEGAKAAVDLPALIAAIEAGDDHAIATALNVDAGIQEGLLAELNGGLVVAILAGVALAMRDFASRHGSRVQPEGEMRRLTDEFARNLSVPLARRAHDAAMMTLTTLRDAGASAHEVARATVASLDLAPDQARSIALLHRALHDAVDTIEKTGADILPVARKHSLIRQAQTHLNAAQRSALLKALSNPLDRQTATQMVDRHRRALRDFRRTTIARQEASRSAHLGEYLAFRQGQANRSIPRSARRFWRTRGDERVRHSHSLIPAMNAAGVGVGETFQTPLGPVLYPPVEINCRCRVDVKTPEAAVIQ